MKRRNFMQKTLIASGAVAFGVTNSTNAFADIFSKQNFDFMTQSHPNLTLINNFFTAYANNDLEGVRTILAEDIQWHIPGEHPLSGTKKGVKEVLEFFKKLSKVALKAEPIVMGVNDSYVIDCHRNWSETENDENLNSMSCLLWKIENNKIKEVYNFPENQKDVNTFFTKIFG